MQNHDYEAAICGCVFERHRGSAGPTLLQLKKKTELEPSQLLQLRCNCEMLASKCCKECASEYQNKTCFLVSKWCEWYVFASNCCKYLACPSLLFGPNNINAYVLSSLWNMCLTLMICCLSTYYTYIRTYVRTYVRTYMHTCIHAYMHTCIHAYMHPCMHAYIHTYIHAYIHTDLDIHVYEYVYAEYNMYTLYIYT